MNDPRGSIWRKWDLHVHTPNTKLSDSYRSDDPTIDLWEKFIEIIKNTDVSVFGITDYFSVDGYETFVQKIAHVKDIGEKTFFPNIEFRLLVSTNKSAEEVNIHVIFDTKCKIEELVPVVVGIPAVGNRFTYSTPRSP